MATNYELKFKATLDTSDVDAKLRRIGQGIGGGSGGGSGGGGGGGGGSSPRTPGSSSRSSIEIAAFRYNLGVVNRAINRFGSQMEETARKLGDTKLADRISTFNEGLTNAIMGFRALGPLGAAAGLATTALTKYAEKQLEIADYMKKASEDRTKYMESNREKAYAETVKGLDRDAIVREILKETEQLEDAKRRANYFGQAQNVFAERKANGYGLYKEDIGYGGKETWAETEARLAAGLKQGKEDQARAERHLALLKSKEAEWIQIGLNERAKEEKAREEATKASLEEADRKRKQLGRYQEWTIERSLGRMRGVELDEGTRANVNEWREVFEDEFKQLEDAFSQGMLDSEGMSRFSWLESTLSEIEGVLAYREEADEEKKSPWDDFPDLSTALNQLNAIGGSVAGENPMSQQAKATEQIRDVITRMERVQEQIAKATGATA